MVQATRPTRLPIVKGWTMDSRLREFRKGSYPHPLQFVSFDSRQGKRLLRVARARQAAPIDLPETETEEPTPAQGAPWPFEFGADDRETELDDQD